MSQRLRTRLRGKAPAASFPMMRTLQPRQSSAISPTPACCSRRGRQRDRSRLIINGTESSRGRSRQVCRSSDEGRAKVGRRLDIADATVVLAPAGYDVDPDVGSDPERPWRLIQGLTARGIRVVAVARRVARSTELGPLANIRLLPGSQPTTPTGRLLDRLRLYLHARAVVMGEMERSVPLPGHHFGPCSYGSPSLIPPISAPFVYGPMPAKHPDPKLFAPAEGLIPLGLPTKPPRSARASRMVTPFIWPIARRMWRQTIKHADAVTVEAHANIPPERPDAVVIRPGIDTTFFRPNGAAPKPGRIVAVGGLYRRK